MTATDGWLERDGCRLHFMRWAGAAAQPPVLLLHGLSSNARYWDRTARHLGGRTLVALDQRGHGLTGRESRLADPRAYTMDELVADALFAIDRLELGRPVVAGHSWGAAVALELAGRHPDAASGLVFVDGPVQSVSTFLTWDQAQALMQPPLPLYASLAEATADSRRDFDAAWDVDLDAFVAARVMPHGEGLVLTLTDAVRLELLRGLYGSQPELLWPRVPLPAVALVARHSQARISRATDVGLERLRQIAPEVEVRRFDCPHDIPLYLPAEVAAEIERVATLVARRTRPPKSAPKSG